MKYALNFKEVGIQVQCNIREILRFQKIHKCNQTEGLKNIQKNVK